MKTVQEQLSTYKSVHLNKKNIHTHFVGVPSIIWSLAVLMSVFSIPLNVAGDTYSIAFSIIFFALVLVYYSVLDWRLSLGCMLFILPVVYTAVIVAEREDALLIALAVFVIGWIIQFIGHIYEKAKPAFVDDINQLLIGPFFLMAEIYFKLGLLLSLEKEITPLAIEKRRKIEAAAKS